MQTEVKFKRQVFLRNVMRLKAIIMWFIEISKFVQYVNHSPLLTLKNNSQIAHGKHIILYSHGFKKSCLD